MKIKIYEDRRLLNEKENFGSQYENLATTLIFEFPEYVEKDGIKLATKDLNKTIIFNIEGDNELPIIEDKFSFPYDITKLGEVEWNIAIKEKSETEDMTDKLIWYSETMVSKFEKTNEGKNKITAEKLDSFNVITTVLNEKIAEVEALKVDIGDYKQALDSKVDKEQGKGLSTNDFTNILKEKLENLENYNDEEIRNLLNGSLKNVNYTASNGMLTFTKNDGSTIAVDLPLELLIESGRYDEANSQIVLVLANGNSINIPVSDLLDDFYGKNETYNKTEVDNLILQKQRQIEALEDEIDELIEENKAQQEEIDMLTADYRENTIEGETVAVSDGLAKSKIKADVNGNSYQYSTEGYNLYNVNDKKSASNGITVDKEGWITVTYDNTNGTAIKYFEYFTNAIKNLKPSTNYMIVTEVKEVTGNATLYSNSWGGQFNSDTIYEFSNVKNNGIYVKTNLALASADSKDISLRTIVRYEVGESGSITFRLSCLEDTTITADTFKYEPYTNGASPNIEYPQEVEVITECSLVQRGKNVIQTGSLKLTDGTTGIIITKLAENKYLLNGTTTSQGRILAETFDKPIGKQMTFTANRVSGTATGGFQILLYTGGDTWNQATKSLNLQSNKTVTDKLLESDYGLNSSTYQLGFFVGAGAVLNNVEIEVQLEYGEVSTEIEPYIEPTVKPIDLQGNSIAKVGDVKDLLNIGVDGSCKINKNNKFYEFTGNEPYAKSGLSTDEYFKGYLTVPDSNYVATPNFGYCNMLRFGMYSATTEGELLFTGNQKHIQIKANKLSENSVAGLQAFFKELYDNGTPMKMLGQLAKPEIIDLPSIEPITLFEGTNVFELITNLGTTMSVTYKVSNKSLDKRISALESALIGG